MSATVTTASQGEVKSDVFEVMLKVQIPVDRIRDVLCSAFEGGSGYWLGAADVKYSYGPHKKEDFNLKGKFNQGTTYYHPSQRVPSTPGCNMTLTVDDPEDENGEKTIQKDLNLVVLRQGLVVMADQYPQHLTDIINENDDASTGDVFLQCCLFGKIIYG